MILIPTTIWVQAQRIFRRNRKKVEQVCFLDGYRVGKLGVVTTLTFPQADIRKGFYHVPHSEVRRASIHLRTNSMVRLAQIHTHPSDWVGHSAYDNDNAYSAAVGALSLVLPHYGRRECDLDDAGVHLMTQDGWTEILLENRGSVLALVPSVVDLRGDR